MNYCVWIQNDSRDRGDPVIKGPFFDREAALRFCRETRSQPYWREAWLRIAPVGTWEDVEPDDAA